MQKKNRRFVESVLFVLFERTVRYDVRFVCVVEVVVVYAAEADAGHTLEMA